LSRGRPREAQARDADYYYYTYTGLRYRAMLAGTTYRYLYNGERVLEELNDSGTMQARYTTEDGSYYGQWLHLYRPSGSLSRFPMYDNIGSARGLLDASGTATDWYELDTFGRQVSSSGTTPNPYRYGGAWGYISDPSGLQQLGHRFYWPELGRFVSQDPIGDGDNWYEYAASNPVMGTDPDGERARQCSGNGNGRWGSGMEREMVKHVRMRLHPDPLPAPGDCKRYREMRKRGYDLTTPDAILSCQDCCEVHLGRCYASAPSRIGWVAALKKYRCEVRFGLCLEGCDRGEGPR
jgi:RHS repeat-associated protein